MINSVKFGSSHNERIQNPIILNTIIKTITNDVCFFNNSLPKTKKLDAIVCCGISGAGVAFPVSANLGIPLWLVRKEKEVTHSQNDIDINWSLNEKKAINYIIIDDLIDSGKTMNRMIYVMESLAFNRGVKSKAHKAFLYNSSKTDERDFDCYIDDGGTIVVPCKNYAGWEWRSKAGLDG